jgi:hypothetical protein
MDDGFFSLTVGVPAREGWLCTAQLRFPLDRLDRVVKDGGGLSLSISLSTRPAQSYPRAPLPRFSSWPVI